MTRVVLASGSPRRRELLAALVPDFDVEVSHVPEVPVGDAVADAVRLAADKSRAVAAGRPNDVVIGGDTIVHDGRRQYGKPASPDEAFEMLQTLRGRAHTVVTGLAVAQGDRLVSAHSEATVLLADLSDEAIRTYVASGRPLDKAGAYAIQDDDVPTVSRLEGCYCCVMGLPLWRLRSLLDAAGLEVGDPAITFARCASCPERPGC